jgi:hypothetical protein
VATAACQENLEAVFARESACVDPISIDERQSARLATLLHALAWDRIFTPHAILDDAFIEETVEVLMALLRAWSASPASG